MLSAFLFPNLFCNVHIENHSFGIIKVNFKLDQAQSRVHPKLNLHRETIHTTISSVSN